MQGFFVIIFRYTWYQSLFEKFLQKALWRHALKKQKNTPNTSKQEKLLPVKRKNFSCYNIHIYKIFSLIYATIPDPEPASFSPLVVEQELIVPLLYPAIAPSYVPE